MARLRRGFSTEGDLLNTSEYDLAGAVESGEIYNPGERYQSIPAGTQPGAGGYQPGQIGTDAPPPYLPGPNDSSEAPPPVSSYAPQNLGWGTGTNSYKAQLGGVLGNYDPKGGFTPEIIEELNKLGLAEFYSPGGDRLGYRNVTDAGRKAEMLDSEFFGDFIGNYGAENAGWQFDWNDRSSALGGGGGGGFSLPPGAAGMPGSGGSGGGFGGGGGFSSTRNPNMDEIMNQLRGLFPDGAFNEDVVNRRTSMATDALERQRKSRQASNRAILADRGLIGSGPEQTAQNRMESDLADQYASAVSGIYADESEAADQRMMQALSLAANMSMEEASQLIDWFRAQTDRDLGHGQLALGHRRAGIDETLGLGNLALGNLNAMNSYNLGLGNLGLGRDRLQYDYSRGESDDFFNWLELWLRQNGLINDGYI